MNGGDKPTFSFGFSKRTEVKKLQSSAIKDADLDKKQETDYLVSVEDNEIKSVKPVIKEGPLVIPLIQQNRWFHARKPEELEADDASDQITNTATAGGVFQQTDDKETNDAVREILSETTQGKYGIPDTNLSIPLLMKNKVPDGYETDDRLDVSLRPDQATEEDYEKVPIEQFGLAMLRGMGWKDGDGIGRTSRVVKPVVPVVRPKGLGLGADKSVLQQKSGSTETKTDSSAREEDLVLKRGSYCRLLGGKCDGQYGTVVGIDEDNARVIVSLAVGSQTTDISQFAIKLVSKAEFEKYSKYINRAKVDEYRAKQEGSRAKSSSPSVVNGNQERTKNRHGQQRSDSEDVGEDCDRHRRHKKHKKARTEEKSEKHKRHRQKEDDEKSGQLHEETSSKRSDRHHSSEEKHTARKENQHKSDKKQRKETPTHSEAPYVWLRPHLRVRIVDENYRRGKYFKTKVTVEDVISAESCICRTDDNQVLDDLSQSQLETVIPRDGATHVMIISGKHRSELGQMLERDRERSRAVVQLLSDRDVAVTLSFDDICEYAADVTTDSFDY